jgi:nucleoside-diphosphate-sugar epimerase
LKRLPQKKLTQVVYNIGAFSVSAKDFYDMIKKAFPIAVVNLKPDPLRKKIVDSWPADLEDPLARKEWGRSREFDSKRAFDEYLIPAVKQGNGK